MSYLIIAAAGGAKRMTERDFDLVIGKGEKSPEEETARWEAFAIRKEIEAHGEANTNGETDQ